MILYLVTLVLFLYYCIKVKNFNLFNKNFNNYKLFNNNT